MRLTAAIVLVSLACGSAAPCHGGGGPENVFLVVNPADADSLAVANAFVSLRRIPPINVFMLPWTGNAESVPIGRFRDEILGPILRAIDGRRLATQIDCVVYSSGFPWRVDYVDELPADIRAKDQFPSGSLTGMTMLHAAVNSGAPNWLSPQSNLYFRPVAEDGVPAATLGFRSWYGWGRDGALLEAGGNRYLLSAMLGVTAGRGNTVAEILAYLKSAAAADGSRPKGTMYFMTNGDVRTTTRGGAFPAIVAALNTLGVNAEIATGPLPERKADVAGLMAGTPTFNWRASNSAIVPGAICENLTSFGGIFTASAGQTPLSEFLRAGAAGSSGTVTEPFALQEKFPHASLQVHYARGASLIEAFYQSVSSPYQLIVVGDPLCQPWATIPSVEVVSTADSKVLEPGTVVSGTLELEPRVSGAGPDGADRFELYVDGIRVAQAGLGEKLVFDTVAVADGHHELRLVAISATPVATQGRRIIPVIAANHGRSLTLSVEPRRVRLGETLRIGVQGSGIDGAVVFALGRVIGRTAAAEAVIEVPADVLGLGTVTIRATGRGGPLPADGVNAEPVMVQVSAAR
jgi:uncharacterized protein (TIGR03790 family)